MSAEPSNAEMVRRLLAAGVLKHVGWAYPAQAADADNAALIEQFGEEFGPWQFLDLGEGPITSLDSSLMALDPAFRPEIDLRAAPPVAPEEPQHV